MKRGGLAIILGEALKRKRPTRNDDDDVADDAEADDEARSACDMALGDAYDALKAGDREAFATAMRDALAAYSDE